MSEAIEILVVEDSLTQARQLQRLLQDNGYSVLLARNGQEALELLRVSRPAVMVSDIVMPQMDGYELCRRVKDDDALKDIPVILLTILKDPLDVIRSIEARADSFLTKPYAGDLLLARIRQVLENVALRNQDDWQAGRMVFYAGRQFHIQADPPHVVDLLLATYENAVLQNVELERANERLADALANVKTLRGLLPICQFCKKIRDDDSYWRSLEGYLAEHSEATLSHGICPDCYTRHVQPQIDETRRRLARTPQAGGGEPDGGGSGGGE